MTEPTDALIPCPFCGSPDVAIADDLVTFNGLCNACGASGGYSSYRNGATWLWNRRTPQPTQAQAGAVPLTDEQCDAIYEALDAFGREVDHYEYGLPYCTSDGETLAKPEAREVIRQAAQNIKGADHG